MSTQLTLRAALVLLLLPTLCQANDNILEYTDREAFVGALDFLGLDSVQVLDFEDAPVGEPIPPGGTIGGIEFSVPSVVANDVSTTSGSNYLGVADPDSLNRFTSYSGFSFGFPEGVHAVGFDIVASSPLAEVSLGVATGASTDGTPLSVLDDGGLVYFIGLTSTETDFDVGSVFFPLQPTGSDPIFYAVDNFTTATFPEAAPVDEPRHWTLAAAALLALVAARSVRRHTH